MTLEERALELRRVLYPEVCAGSTDQEKTTKRTSTAAVLSKGTATVGLPSAPPLSGKARDLYRAAARLQPDVLYVPLSGPVVIVHENGEEYGAWVNCRQRGNNVSPFGVVWVDAAEAERVTASRGTAPVACIPHDTESAARREAGPLRAVVRGKDGLYRALPVRKDESKNRKGEGYGKRS